MENAVPISDHAVWFKHLHNRHLRQRLATLEPEAEITLEADSVTGRWRRMKRGVDGRLPDAIIPVGPMKEVWNKWFRTRRGDLVVLRIVTTADDYLTAQTPLFSEWASPEDDEAFDDL
jgi:hypothetical protein